MKTADRPGDFFTRLVGRALGLTPSAMPLLAPIYAPGPALTQAAASPFTQDVERTPEADLPQPMPGAPLPGRDEGTPPTGVKTKPDLPSTVSVPPEVEPLAGRVNAPASGDEAPALLEPPVTPVNTAAPREQPDEIVLPSSRESTPPSTQALFPPLAAKPELPSQPAVSPIQQAFQPGEAQPDVERGTAVSSARREGPLAAPLREPARILVPLERLAEASTLPQGTEAVPGEGFPGPGSPFQPAPVPASLPERSDTPLLPLEGRSEPQAVPGRSVPASPAAPLPQPIVRITIGRVEVRAVQPTRTSPPAPAPSSRPALSLDEYLKQRNEARR